MTAPAYVATKPGSADRFVPGPGLPTITPTPQLVSDQTSLNNILAAAGRAGIEIRFYATGTAPGPQTVWPFVHTVNGNAADSSGDVAVAGGGGPIASTSITDSTTTGRAVLTAASQAAARAAIGAVDSAAVTAAVTAVVGAAPGTLDTIAEIDAAINNDPSFATTMATALATKPTLDGAGHIPLSTLPIGSTFTITSPDGGTTWTDKAGTTITARPTSRTDLVMECETTGSTLPAWAITGDYLAKIN